MFKGQRQNQGVIVFHNKEILSPKESQKLVNHSPTGFEWGYCGSGPAQLSLAILLSHTKDQHLALDMYNKFLFDVISKIHSTDWEISNKKIEDWIKAEKTIKRKAQ